MKKNIILTAITLCAIIAFACNNNTPKTDNKDLPAIEITKVSYTCPMHAEIHSDKPGKCPICGMDLVKEDIPATNDMTTK
jgi:Cu(I)/Ag(I) efflux system membrane fusion protein